MEVERRPAVSSDRPVIDPAPPGRFGSAGRRTTAGVLTPSGASSRHPLVDLDYRLRVPGMLIVGLIPLSHFYREPHPFWFWGAMFLTRLGLAVSDVCDKGVGAALFMAVFRSLIRTAMERDDEAGVEAAASVGATAAHNSDYIARTHGKANMFATLFLGVLDPGSGALTYVNAGHEPPVVRRASGALVRLLPTGPAVGLLPGLRFEVRETRLLPGDALLAFTDGVSEARSPAGELYGEGRLLALLEGQPLSSPALLSRVEESLRAHSAGGEPTDDITMLAVRRTQ